MTNPAPWVDGGLQWITASVVTGPDAAAPFFLTKRTKISFVISLLTGRVLQWAETIWQQASPVTQSLDSFVVHFWEVFG